jgi:methylamine dehydrogenase light chain
MKPVSRTRFDRVIERFSRSTAQHTSRRSFLSQCGLWLVAASALPLLPVSRRAQAADAGAAAKKPKFASEFANTAQTSRPTECNYWRYCSSDGYLCACCGGGPSTCPPGTSPSPTTWVGSCINPDDGKTYLIAYRDCCGQDSCGKCACLGQEGDMPTYRPQVNNDIVWCFGASSMVYHCSSAGLVGLAE